MTDNLTGRLASVATLPLVGFLASDAPIGTTVLDLEEASDFDADGGVVLLSGGNPLVPAVSELVAYDTADDDTATLTLSAPTTVAFFAGDRVELWDNAEGTAVVETVAQVVLPGDAGNVDPVEATVDHALIPYLVEGIRAPGAEEAVALEWRGRSLFVVDVLGRIPVMDGGMIDPDTLPPSGGPEPSTPVTPAAPTVYGGVGMLIVRWEGITHPNPVEYEVHVSEVSGFLPGPTTLIGVITGTQMSVRRLPVPDVEATTPDSALLYDTPYFAAIIARDSVDPSYVSGKSAEGTGMAIQVTGADLAADSVTANNIVAGSITGESFAGELLLGSRITTAENGQRVEMDAQGFRLYNSEGETRVNLPTATGEDPSFQGRVTADGLTVNDGAQFFSTLNEFAKDSAISLAEQVGAPVAAPDVAPWWNWQTLSRVSWTGSKGSFGMDPASVFHVTWNASTSKLYLLQRAPGGGTRVWYYNLDGTISTLWDGIPDSWDVTSLAVGSDGEMRIMFALHNTTGSISGWWIYDYSLPDGDRSRQYIPINQFRRPILSMDGNTVIVTETETADGSSKFRVVNTATSPVTITSTTTGTGDPGKSVSPIFVYRGSADFGSTRWITAYAGTGPYRTFSSSGVYNAAEGFPPPVARVGAFWHPTNGAFYTMGSDGRLYRHSTMKWTNAVQDTWHLAQTFMDANATGGTHETVVGAVRTFSPVKRAWVRVTPTPVPFAGGTDDPNQWWIYGKTGTAPGVLGAGLTFQLAGNRTTATADIGAMLTTSGVAPPTVSNFPNATPARMYSGRTMPSDGTKRIFEVRGDGAGRWGPFEFTGDGQVTGMGVAAGWQNLPLINGNTQRPGAAYTPQFLVIGPVVYLRGQLTGPAGGGPAGGAVGQLPFTLPKEVELGNFSQLSSSQPAARVFISAAGQITLGNVATGVTWMIIGGSTPII